MTATQMQAGGGRRRLVQATGLLACAAGLLAATHVVAQNAGDQVLAKVGSTQITRAMVQREMPSGVNNPAVLRNVLQSIITRKLLAQEARRQGIDKTPIGAMAIKRANELATVSLLERKYAGTPPTITDAQVNQFINDHPTMFARRRLMALDQILVEAPTRATTDSLKAANSMAEFEQVLQRDRSTIQRGSVVLDTLNMDPKIADTIAAFQAGGVFITPRPDGALTLSNMTSNTLVPVTGTAAQRMARIMLMRSQVAQRVQDAAGKVVKAGQDEVKINPQYEPKATAKKS